MQGSGRQMTQSHAGRPYIVPQANPINDAGTAGNDGNDGEFRCKTCLRGPPLTKKYAKNQCQTCYKREKKIQKEGHEAVGMYGNPYQRGAYESELGVDHMSYLQSSMM